MTQPTPRYVAYLEDILDAAQRAIQFTHGWSYSRFQADEVVWRTTREDLPDLLDQIREVLDELSDSR